MTVKDEDFTGKRNLTSLGEDPIRHALAAVQNALFIGAWVQAWHLMDVLISTPGNVDLSTVGRETIREKEHEETLMLSWQGVNDLETNLHRWAWYGQSMYTWSNSFMQRACMKLYAEITMKLKVHKYFEDSYGGVDANREVARL